MDELDSKRATSSSKHWLIIPKQSAASPRFFSLQFSSVDTKLGIPVNKLLIPNRKEREA
jgi:hypothetical protein